MEPKGVYSNQDPLSANTRSPHLFSFRVIQISAATTEVQAIAVDSEALIMFLLLLELCTSYKGL